MPKLLVIDDEPSILLAFRRAFRDPALELLTAESADEGLAMARQQRPDVVVLDIHMPGTTGLEALSKFQQLDAHCPVILISGKGTTDTAIEAMKRGAYDYLLKPLELPALRQVIERALEISRAMRVRAVVADAEPTDDRADAIIGRCPAMQEVYKAIGRVAAQEVTVLITGESGTGKELVARAIYQHGPRASGPFLAINCAAIPENLLESELFGHEQGAFTGAERRRIGKFEQCSGGTIFLDEVGDMPPLTQSKMLRLLQDQAFERVGGNETIRTDVRLIAATNQDLERLAAQGKFRQDLLYRLSVFTIPMPPLRERGDDLGLLVQHYLRRFNRELKRNVDGVAPEYVAALERYPWPGNVRELQSVLKQSLLKATGPVLLADFLPETLTRAEARPAEPATTGQRLEDFIDEQLRAGADNLYEATLKRIERVLLTRVLQHTDGNQVQAAKILGITRGSVRTKIRELGISIGRTIDSGDDGDTGK
jgi:two-component system nitrogen regulation response regulator GlnG